MGSLEPEQRAARAWLWITTGRVLEGTYPQRFLCNGMWVGIMRVLLVSLLFGCVACGAASCNLADQGEVARDMEAPPVAPRDDLGGVADAARPDGGAPEMGAVDAGHDMTPDDMAASKLARDIVRKIEETLVYPGQIKVMVIRESRTIEYAR